MGLYLLFLFYFMIEKSLEKKLVAIGEKLANKSHSFGEFFPLSDDDAMDALLENEIIKKEEWTSTVRKMFDIIEYAFNSEIKSIKDNIDGWTSIEKEYYASVL